jgi:protein-tyrosine-phosphatase
MCKYNAFRSRIAEGYFNKINKNPKIKVISRGFIMGGNADKEQKFLAKQLLEIDIGKRNPLPVKLQELIDYDLIIVVANDIPKLMFDYQLVNLEKKLIIWRIKDEQKKNTRNIKRTILEIKRKVDDLNKKLGARR